MKSYLLNPLVVCTIVVSIVSSAGPAWGQQHERADLYQLLSVARDSSPALLAAWETINAARAQATAAGRFPDPRLGVALVNGLVSDPLSSRDFMTMRTVRIVARLPFPGKLALEREAARRRLDAAQADFDQTELEVVASVERAYYELYFLDRSRAIVQQNLDLLSDLVTVTEVRYGVGAGTQSDVLKAQVERTQLGDELLILAERRATTLARLSAVLDRPTNSPVEAPTLPERVERAAVPEPGTQIGFATAVLGTGASGPIPDLATLQSLARERNPALRAFAARIEVQRAETLLAEKAALPDFDVSIGYGQRSGREDMVSLAVTAPIPLFKGRKQDALARGERAELARVEANRRTLANDIDAEVARLHAALVSTRDRLGLLVDGILPQARVSLESAVAGYPVDRVDFLTLLDNQVTLFRHDLDYFRLLSEFAKNLSDLEKSVGTEVLQ